MEEEAAAFVNAEKGVANAKEAIAGAKDIIAEMIADMADYRKSIRNCTMKQGSLVVKAKDEKAESVYEMYYDFREPLSKVTGYRVLAINRGEKEKFLTVKVEAPDVQIVNALNKTMVKDNLNTKALMEEAILDAYNRLIAPSIERDIRSEITEKDFIIGKFCLKEIVRNVSLKNKDDLLENQIKLEVNIDNLNVYTDKKWLEFILNQIVNNSIKYKKNNNSIINITAHEEKDKIILSVYDNGIGIPSKDIKRVFDKSFTGTNGRDKVKSTGMGLYIIKNLCNKLGHNIYIKSEENKYTNVVIEFGKNKYYKF